MSGPLPRKKLYRHIMKQLMNDGYFDTWRQTVEICDRVNKQIPLRWTPVYPSSIFRYMRELPVEERYLWKNNVSQMVREWKKL